MLEKNKKVIVITAASSDLGIGITRDLLSLGHKVFAHYVNNRDRLRDFESENFQPFRADLTDDKQVHALAIAAKKRFGTVDALINMIGPFAASNVLEETPSAWRKTIELNLNVIFSSCHYFKDELIQSKGHILNFGYAGIENLTAWPAATAYAAAKAGLVILSKSLSQAFAPHGVRVNTICPGWIDSGHFSSEKIEKINSEIPSGRIGRPEEVSALVRWILLESPAYLTNAFIPIGGGIEF